MEISMPFETNMPLAYIVSDNKPFFISEKHFVSRISFSLNPRKSRNSFHSILCSSIETALQAKPKPIQRPTNIIVEDDVNFGYKLCSHIENLVFHKQYIKALEFLDVLMSRDDICVESSTFVALVNACIELKSITGAKRVFGFMIDSAFEMDQYTRNRILLMHVKCGMMFDARQLFIKMPDRNIVSWNIIIGGLVDSGEFFEALTLFHLMWCEFGDAGPHTFVNVIVACTRTGLLSMGRQLHSCILKLGTSHNIFLSCALIDMYSKCECIDDGRFVFDVMPEKTTVGWNSIITGYALHGYSEEALSMYYKMRDSGAKMDHFTFSMVVRICARLASVAHAKQAHAGLVRHGFGSDVGANTALVDFYTKWGKIEDARHVFDKMPNKNVKSWNALIAGYGRHGRGMEAVNMFNQMVHEDRMIPNHVTFLALLSACSCCGLSDLGWKAFESMEKEFAIKPRAMHYACMVELLGREGRLDESFALIKNAPLIPTLNMWASLITACRVHKNTELGKLAAEEMFRLDPEKLSNYIMLLNIYKQSGQLEEASNVLKTLKRRGLKIVPACSWIEVNKKSHVFFCGDEHHAQSKEVRQKCDELMISISKLGYVVEESKYVLSDVDEREGAFLSYHSEKLAVAFGLMNTAEWVALQVVQSHRICNDCHNAVKMIAMISGREIIVRDSSRFHHFKNGSCSCGDYW